MTKALPHRLAGDVVQDSDGGAGTLVGRGEHRKCGVVALLGRRFLREPYRGLLPEDWLGGGLPEDLVGDPAAVAQEFFAGPLESRA